MIGASLSIFHTAAINLPSEWLSGEVFDSPTGWLAALRLSLIEWRGEAPVATLPFGLLLTVNVFSVLIIGMLGVQLVRSLRVSWQARARKQLDTIPVHPRSERTRVQALYDLVACLGSTLNYQRVLETVVDLSAKALDGPDRADSRLVSAVLLFDDDVLKVAAERRLTTADARGCLAGKSGVIAACLADGQPCLLQNPAVDPELNRLAALHACKSAMVLPLRSGRDVYGLLLYAHPEQEYFNPERKEILQVITQQAVTSIQNARLYQALEREKERIVEIQEEARKKLARDLHDGPTQTVAAIAMRASVTRKMLELGQPGAADELAQIEEMARRTTNEIRHMLFTLRPLVLESEGLAAALNMMAQKVRETFGQAVHVEVASRPAGQLDIGKQTIIFYLAEEAVTNARKHAKAAHIWVRLRGLPNEAEIALLEIEDDGVGFETSRPEGEYERSGSLGMVNLRERTQLINGVLNIQSTPGHGTRVQVAIPLSEHAAERLRTA